jgi:hypothetical protein
MRVCFASKGVLMRTQLTSHMNQNQEHYSHEQEHTERLRVTGCTAALATAKTPCSSLLDALASEAGARSFPELSFSPFFERTWASLYEALEDGQIDAERLRHLSLWTARHCPNGVRSCFWAWIPAICIAQKLRLLLIGRWFPWPICPRTRMPRVPLG